jgi:hypothetical protein
MEVKAEDPAARTGCRPQWPEPVAAQWVAREVGKDKRVALDANMPGQV